LSSVPGNSEEVITQKTSELPEVFDRKAEIPGCRCNVTEFRYAHLCTWKGTPVFWYKNSEP
jgi:hypothetical protein